MQYSAIILALATGSFAAYTNGTVPVVPVVPTYETITTSAITTYCPSATTVVQGSKTYTVTEATTLTITDCPCTVVKPVYPTAATASTVLYTSCPPESSSKPVPQPPKSVPGYSQPLTAVYTAAVTTAKGSVGTTYTPAKPTGTVVYTGAASANKVGSFVVGAAALAAMAL